MSLLAPARLTSKEATAHGAYLTDEKRLFQVLGTEGDRVKLENCRYPNEPATWCPVGRVLETMRRVVPEK